MNSKEDTWFWDNNFNNFKRRNNDIIKIVLSLEESDILLK